MKKILLKPLFIPKTSLQLVSLPVVYDKLFLVCPPVFVSNEQQFTSMYEEYHKQLYRYCFCRVSSLDVALDIVQETFHRTWQYLQKGKIIIHSKAFLYTTARNLIIDEYRKKKHDSLDLLIGTELEPRMVNEENIHMQTDMPYIIKHINQLSKTYSDVLLMRYIDDCSIAKIAESLNISENVVSVRIFRGLSKLRLIIHS